MQTPTYTQEIKLLKEYQLIAGVDEAGRGTLAGPVVAAAVVLDPQKVGVNRTSNKWWYELKDSKLLKAEKREKLVKIIRENAVDYALGEVSHTEIDEINIHHASLLAMKRAVEGLEKTPDHIMIDGKFTIPDMFIAQQNYIKGDLRVLSIAAASVLAKVYRDAVMKKLATIYKEYGFEKHKGYNTSFHRKMLIEHGTCPVHRMSFPAVRDLVSQSKQTKLEVH